MSFDFIDRKFGQKPKEDPLVPEDEALDWRYLLPLTKTELFLPAKELHETVRQAVESNKEEPWPEPPASLPEKPASQLWGRGIAETADGYGLYEGAINESVSRISLRISAKPQWLKQELEEIMKLYAAKQAIEGSAAKTEWMLRRLDAGDVALMDKPPRVITDEIRSSGKTKLDDLFRQYNAPKP